MRRFNFLCAGFFAVVAVQGVAPRMAHAQADSVQLATEEMMEDSASQNSFLQLEYGYSSVPQSLNYTSQITTGTDTASFNYSTLPGQTYQGQPVSLTSSGTATYDPATSTWTWASQSSGSGSKPGYPSQPFTSTDVETVKKVNGNYVITSDYNYYGPGGMGPNGKTGDLHIMVTVDPNTWVDTDSGYRTDYNGNVVPNSGFTSNSKLNKATGKWEIELGPSPFLPVYASATGTSDPTTGVGAFVATLPEPSSVALVGLAAMGLLQRASRKHA